MTFEVEEIVETDSDCSQNGEENDPRNKNAFPLGNSLDVDIFPVDLMRLWACLHFDFGTLEVFDELVPCRLLELFQNILLLILVLETDDGLITIQIFFEDEQFQSDLFFLDLFFLEINHFDRQLFPLPDYLLRIYKLWLLKSL